MKNHQKSKFDAGAKEQSIQLNCKSEIEDQSIVDQLIYPRRSPRGNVSITTMGELPLLAHSGPFAPAYWRLSARSKACEHRGVVNGDCSKFIV